MLVLCWTAYPVAFGSIMSTLSIPLFIAALGIILRGVSYALRGQLDGARGRRPIENLFALSSILTPFALGTVIGAIASGRVPVGNAQGDPWSSWTGPTSLMIGVLAVAVGGYLAAVYLSADARRLRKQMLELHFRDRALVAGVVAGGLALAGLLVVRENVPSLWDGLTHGWGAAMVAVSAVAGVTSLVLVWRSQFGPVRSRPRPPSRQSSPAGASPRRRACSPASRSSRPRPATRRWSRSSWQRPSARSSSSRRSSCSSGCS